MQRIPSDAFPDYLDAKYGERIKCIIPRIPERITIPGKEVDDYSGRSFPTGARWGLRGRGNSKGRMFK